MLPDVEKAKERLEKGNHSCVLFQNDRYTVSDDSGIRPLINWLASPDSPLCGAAVADKIVGRAAALLFVYAGVKAVYGRVMSQKAAAVLQQAGIPYAYEKAVPYIINRRGDGMCPMEQKVEGVESPAEAYGLLKAAVAAMPESGPKG